MAEDESEPKPRGTYSEFRPKVAPPVSIMLTQLAKDILEAASVRTGMSRSNVVEQLLRQHGGAAQAMPRQEEGANGDQRAGAA